MKEQNRETRTTETITISRAEYDAQKAQLAELQSRNEWLIEQLRLLKKKQFGSSSEQTAEQLDGQLSLLFNEAEAYTVPPGSPKSTQVAAHTRKRSGSVKDVVPDNIPVEVVEHRLSEVERVCPQCGEVMREIGTEVRETLKFIPARAVLQRDVYYTYACENCQKNDIATPIMKAPKEPSVIPGSFASAEAIAHKPNRSPAKRVRFGEEEQGSGMRNAHRAFRIRADIAPTRWPALCTGRSRNGRGRG